MSLRDEVQQNLQNVAQDDRKEREAELCGQADMIYKKIREHIVLCSKNHTGGAFRVELLLVCVRSCFDKVEGPWKKGFFQEQTQINTVTLQPDIALQTQFIREKLEKEGVRVTDLRYRSGFSLSEYTDATPYELRSTPFALYNRVPNRQGIKVIDLDPMQPITEKQSRHGRTQGNTLWIQGDQQYANKDFRDCALCMELTYSF